MCQGKIYTKDEHPAAKITQDAAEFIRAEYPKGLLTQDMVGEVFGITQSQVSQIVLGKNRC